MIFVSVSINALHFSMKTVLIYFISIIIITEIGSAAYETDEQVKEKKWEQVNKESIPFYLEKLDNVAKENNGHFALGRVSY